MTENYTVGVMPNTKVLRIERSIKYKAWLVWIQANSDMTVGTYLALYDSGKIQRVTVGSGMDEILEVKGED